MRLGSSSRPALTLVEVLVALAILLLALVGLGYLMNAAGNRAREAQIRTEAMLHAQSKMSEVLAGSVPLQGLGEEPVDEGSEYRWSMECAQGSVDGVWNVTIQVSRSRALGAPLTVHLQQLVLDPSRIGSTQDVPPSSSSSSSGSSSTSGTGR